MKKLTHGQQEVLAALRACSGDPVSPGNDHRRWTIVDLDEVILKLPRTMTRRQFAGYLSQLKQHGLYRQDMYGGSGLVLDE
jgi:hypothetical protein